MLKLSRPLICFDVETTGPRPLHDRVCQIGLVKMYPDGTQTEYQTLINPNCPIPPEITAIHGITDEMVRDAPFFYNVAGILHTGFMNCDVAGFNVKFDIAFLIAEFRRINIAPERGVLDGMILDAYKIFIGHERRDLTAAVKFYLQEELEGAHDALTDAKAALRVLLRQVEVYDDVPKDVEGIHRTLWEEVPANALDPDGKIVWLNNEACLNFGKDKVKGRPLREIDRGYLKWMLNGDFSSQVKAIVRDALNGKYPVREVKDEQPAPEA